MEMNLTKRAFLRHLGIGGLAAASGQVFGDEFVADSRKLPPGSCGDPRKTYYGKYIFPLEPTMIDGPSCQVVNGEVVAPARMDGKLLNHETIRTTNVFMAAYSFIFVGSFLLISLNGFDMVTNFTAVAATLNNIGPGLELVGPMQNFGGFADPAKLVLIFDMLAGRLEIFPMLVLFLPDTWRRF